MFVLMLMSSVNALLYITSKHIEKVYHLVFPYQEGLELKIRQFFILSMPTRAYACVVVILITIMLIFVAVLMFW